MSQRLLYATPTGKHPHVGYCMNVRALELGCKTFVRGVEDFRFAVGPVQMARSKIANMAIDEGFDYVVMHDDDLVINPVSPVGNPIDVWHEIMDKDPRVGMVGAVYLREHPLMPNVVMPHPEYPEELCHTVAGFPFAPIKCGGVGTGFVMIRVSALAALQDDEESQGAPPLFRFSHDLTRWGTVAETGEDYNFCRRLRGIGYDVLADPRFATTHIKDSGGLKYERNAWEHEWDESNPDCKANVDAFRSVIPQAARMIIVNGFLCIDHVPQRKLEAQAWHARMKKRAQEAA